MSCGMGEKGRCRVFQKQAKAFVNLSFFHYSILCEVFRCVLASVTWKRQEILFQGKWQEDAMVKKQSSWRDGSLVKRPSILLLQRIQVPFVSPQLGHLCSPKSKTSGLHSTDTQVHIPTCMHIYIIKTKYQKKKTKRKRFKGLMVRKDIRGWDGDYNLSCWSPEWSLDFLGEYRFWVWIRLQLLSSLSSVSPMSV